MSVQESLLDTNPLWIKLICSYENAASHVSTMYWYIPNKPANSRTHVHGTLYIYASHICFMWANAKQHLCVHLSKLIWFVLNFQSVSFKMLFSNYISITFCALMSTLHNLSMHILWIFHAYKVSKWFIDQLMSWSDLWFFCAFVHYKFETSNWEKKVEPIWLELFHGT